MVRRLLIVVVLAGVVFSLFGCQTVQGIGRDITWLGEKTAEALDK